ncbi:MAG: SLBB domain-containing protein [Kiloniellales bacterium]|nr:SLBB domain-containing protein [Kiloniellales bacterium]
MLPPVDYAIAQSISDELRRLDPSLQQRFGGTQQPLLNETTREIVSPVDSLELEGRVDTQLGYPMLPEEHSRLEEDYAERISVQAPEFGKRPLEQFGYGLLGSMSGLQEPGTGGAINDSYRLGIGDELIVTFRGQSNESYRTAVDREGQIFLPNMPPVPAAGLSFGQFREELERQAEVTLLRTDVFVSLGRVRNFPVMVLGQVRQPGVHRMTGVASVFDAIAAAGGVQKSGSMRHIQLIRGGRSFGVDLYDLLLTGQLDEDLALMEGDRVFVPPIGKTIGIAGDVQRPGIYEVNGRADDMSVGEAVDMAGGTLRPSGYRYLVMTSDVEGGDTVVEVEDPQGAPVRRGDMILVAKMGYSWEGAFFVDGHVSVPGPRSLRWDRTVGSVVNASDILRENPYLLFAALETTDPVTKARHLVPVDLGRIAAGQSDVPLKPNDRLIVLGMDDIRFLSSAAVQAVINGENPDEVIAGELLGGVGMRGGASDGGSLSARDLRESERSGFAPSELGRVGVDARGSLARPAGLTAGSALGSETSISGLTGCKGLYSLASVVSRSRSERFAKARLFLNPETEDAVPVSGPCPEIFDRYPNLLPFVLDYVVAVQGEVRIPGVYPVAPGTSAGSVVPVVGGLTPAADLGQIELSRFEVTEDGSSQASVRNTIDARKESLARVPLQPGDIVRFNPRFSQRDAGSVFLSGEFKRPGVYTIRRGERLSEIVARAGGLTMESYPEGSVFTRIRVQEQERRAFQRAALDLESGLAEALASGNIQQKGDTDPQAVVMAVRDLATRLRQTDAVGRVVVEADPTVLDARPELDTILEPGDRLHVPKRPNHVTVSGEVLNPGTIQFRSGKAADAYIKAAGGTQQAADEGRIFVVLPNGEAQPLQVSSWNYDAVQIPPGSTIVVPRDPKPFDLTAFSVTVVDILSKLAISAASLAVINR